MTVRVVLSHDMTVYSPQQDAEKIIDFCRRKLRFTDPEYLQMKKAGLFIPYRVYNNRFFYAVTVEEHDGLAAISLPRGFWNRLRRFLYEKKIKYRLIDKMVTHNIRGKFSYAVPTDVRDYQKRCVDRAVKAESGIIVAPCGSGKTQILTEIIRRLRQWTLIVVNTDDLMQQMVERLSKALGEDIGIIKQKQLEIKRITVASVQTLSRRLRDGDLSQKTIRRFGCVMLDEAHHMPAESFSEVMTQFPAKYRYGATATPTREDRLHGLMFAVIGYKVAEVTYQELYDGDWLEPALVIPVPTKFQFEMRDRRQYHKLLSALVEDDARNELIAKKLIERRNGYNLVLSRRIEHLERLYEAVLKKRPELESKMSLLIGRMSREERDDVLWQMRNGNINYIFATQLADEGLDMPILSDLHLVFPGRAEGKIQQQVGRIQRKYPDKTESPRVWDYVDTAQNTLRRQFAERSKVYEKTGCKVNSKKIKNTGIAVRRFTV